jgi:hypothetical protein
MAALRKKSRQYGNAFGTSVADEPFEQTKSSGAAMLMRDVFLARITTHSLALRIKPLVRIESMNLNISERGFR